MDAAPLVIVTVPMPARSPERLRVRLPIFADLFSLPGQVDAGWFDPIPIRLLWRWSRCPIQGRAGECVMISLRSSGFRVCAVLARRARSPRSPSGLMTMTPAVRARLELGRLTASDWTIRRSVHSVDAEALDETVSDCKHSGILIVVVAVQAT